MYENNQSLFSHVPAEPEAYPTPTVAHQPLFSSAAGEKAASPGIDTFPEDRAERP